MHQNSSPLTPLGELTALRADQNSLPRSPLGSFQRSSRPPPGGKGLTAPPNNQTQPFKLPARLASPPRNVDFVPSEATAVNIISLSLPSGHCMSLLCASYEAVRSGDVTDHAAASFPLTANHAQYLIKLQPIRKHPFIS